MDLCRRQLRTLRGIERDLADSDPGLDALFRAFTRHAARRDTPQLENVSHWPPRMLAWLRRRWSRTEPVTDRYAAGNWNDT